METIQGHNVESTGRPDSTEEPLLQHHISAISSPNTEQLPKTPSPPSLPPPPPPPTYSPANRSQQPLPIYTPHAGSSTSILALLSLQPPPHNSWCNDPSALIRAIKTHQRNTSANATDHEAALPNPITHYPLNTPSGSGFDLHYSQCQIVSFFYNAIIYKQPDIVTLFIDQNLITADTINRSGSTPLLTAVAANSPALVRLLLSYNASPSTFGSVPQPWPHAPISRTPLMLAAALGNLPIVTLLHTHSPTTHALIASDGQTALRLASTNHQAEIVAYLPAVRGGGFRRWKTHHDAAIRRATRACRAIYDFGYVFLWRVPRFFAWSCPKHLVVLPLWEGAKWCWRHRRGFGAWCVRVGRELPGRVRRAVSAIPAACVATAKKMWRFATRTLPRFLWELATERIPAGTKIFARWVWKGVVLAGQSAWRLAKRIAALVHTVVAALVSFFRCITLGAVWNGVCDVLRVVFVSFPQKFWAWLKALDEVMCDVLSTLFGLLGELLWLLVQQLGILLVFVPVKLWVVVRSMGGSVAKAWYEVVVWIDPKA